MDVDILVFISKASQSTSELVMLIYKSHTSCTLPLISCLTAFFWLAAYGHTCSSLRMSTPSCFTKKNHIEIKLR